MMKAFVLTIALLIGFLNLKSQNCKVDSNDILFDFINTKGFENASIGFYAIDVESQKVLFDYNSDLSLAPASVQKIITTSSALEILGKSYKFKTRLLYTGIIDSKGTLSGNIIIEGGGDPSLGSNNFIENYYKHNFIGEWVSAIQEAGIKKINGSVIVDNLIFNNNIPDTWVWEDLGNYYGSGAYGLSIFDNTYYVVLNSPDTADVYTKIDTIFPKLSNLSIINYVKSSELNKDKAYIYGAPLSNDRIIRGTIPMAKDSFVVKGSIPNPPLFAAEYFTNVLKDSNISVSGNPYTTDEFNRNYDTENGKLIFVTQSPTLSAIVDLTNQNSNNLYSEHLLNILGVDKSNKDSNITGVSVIKTFWKEKGINISGMNLFDGSGLSRYNAVTARQISEILLYMKTKSSNSEEFYNSLPIAGKSGSLSNMFRKSSAYNNLRAKSGTLTGVKAYAGYTTTKSGKLIAFAIIVNNFNLSSYKTKKKMEELLINLTNKDF